MTPPAAEPTCAGCVRLATKEMRLDAFDAGNSALKRRKRPQMPSGDMLAIVTAVFKSAGFDLEDFIDSAEHTRRAEGVQP